MPRIGSGTPTGGTGDPVVKKSKNITVNSVLGRSLGTGHEVFNGSNGDANVLLDFKSLVAGAGIGISSDATTITLTSTGSISVDLGPLTTRVQSVETSIAATNSTVTGLTSTVNNVTTDISALQAARTSMAASIDTLTTGVSTNTTATATNSANIASLSSSIGGKLDKAGGTMIGELVLSGAPSQAMAATSKQYVDTVATTTLSSAARMRIVEQSSEYVLTLDDQDRTLIRMNCSTPTNLFIPNDSTVNMAVGSTVLVSWTGTSQITIVGASGVVINSPDSFKIGRRHGKVALVKVSANTWDLEGNLEPL